MGKRLSSHLADQLRRFAEMSPADHARTWAAEFGEPAPHLPADLLARALAYKLQARSLGDLPARIAKQLRVSVGSGAVSVSTAPKAVDALATGSTLVRSWGGKTYTVAVMDDHFLLNGRRYGSLSQIATEITGTRWSGPRFFGLKQASGVARYA